MDRGSRVTQSGILPVILLVGLTQANPSLAGEATAAATIAQGTAIIQMMLRRNRSCAPQSYSVTRIFQAENHRFNQKATMTVETSVDSTGMTDSKLVSFNGSDFIRKQVFQKILDAEQEADRGRQEINITPENYQFRFEGMDVWKGRDSYVFQITPLRKGKYLINGKIWLDREDLQIVRIVGSPAKRPSFWTSGTEIEKEFVKRGHRWFPQKLQSSSSVFLAGKSNLVIEYFYPEDQLANAGPTR